jgi:hypothetical protein
VDAVALSGTSASRLLSVLSTVLRSLFLQFSSASPEALRRLSDALSSHTLLRDLQLPPTPGDSGGGGSGLADDVIAALNSVTFGLLRGALPGEPPIVVDGGGMRITVGYVDSSSLVSTSIPGGSVFTHGDGVRRFGRVVVVRGTRWVVNPYSYALSSSFVRTSVVSVDLFDVSGRLLRVRHDNVPAAFTIDVAPSTRLTVANRELRCSYFDTTAGAWSGSGVVLVDFDVATSAPICASTHYTDFAGLLVPSPNASVVSVAASNASLGVMYVSPRVARLWWWFCVRCRLSLCILSAVACLTQRAVACRCSGAWSHLAAFCAVVLTSALLL